MSKTIINNIIIGDKAIEKEDTLTKELLLEMGFALGLDLDKPITTLVSVMSHKVDEPSEFKLRR